MFSGRPMLPPVMLAVSAVASRTTRMSRSVYEVIEVSVTAPKSYSRLRSASRNSSVNGSSNCVNCSRSPRATDGRVVVNGLPRML
jgi:hypothetical protein